MPLVYYVHIDADGPFCQGEILADIQEHRPLTASPVNPVPTVAFPRPFSIILSSICDLQQDFTERFRRDEATRELLRADPRLDHPRLLTYVLLCELFPKARVHEQEGMNRRIRDRIDSDQDERYHMLRVPDTHQVPIDALRESVIDFKKCFAVPTSSLYASLADGHMRRVAVLPGPYIQDLMHRFFGYLSRVGVPDEPPSLDNI